jgi:hypothetical protein
MAKTNAQIIAAVEKWQSDPRLESLMCKVNSEHGKLDAREVDGKVILACPECGFRQTYIPWIVMHA